MGYCCLDVKNSPVRAEQKSSQGLKRNIAEEEGPLQKSVVQIWAQTLFPLLGSSKHPLFTELEQDRLKSICSPVQTASDVA